VAPGRIEQRVGYSHLTAAAWSTVGCLWPPRLLLGRQDADCRRAQALERLAAAECQVVYEFLQLAN